MPQPEAGEPGAANLRELIVQNLLIYHDQAAALINRRGEILHIHGRTGKYLEPASGYATLNILSMARKGLGRALAAALHGVVSRKEPVHHQGLRIRTNGEAITARLSLRPAQGLNGELLPDIFLLVLDADLRVVSANRSFYRAFQMEPETTVGRADSAGHGGHDGFTEREGPVRCIMVGAASGAQTVAPVRLKPHLP